MKKCIIPTTFATCKYSRTDQKTKPGLAVTPAQMSQMADKGIAISAQNAANFYDGSENPSWDVLPEYERGIDVADLWQNQQTARKKIFTAKRSKKQ